MKVPTVQTKIDLKGYTNAVLRAWRRLYNIIPPKESIAVLWSQFMIETGGRHCYNWNIGNVKHVDGDGFDHHDLVGTWECLKPAHAGDLIAKGLGRPDSDPRHMAACPKGKIPVIFLPPLTFFRSHVSLEHGMDSHLQFLCKRYAAAWNEIIAGDCERFVHALKAGRDGKQGTWDDYFTASVETYARGAMVHYKAFMNSPAYEDALEVLLKEIDTVTLPEMTIYGSPDSSNDPNC